MGSKKFIIAFILIKVSVASLGQSYKKIATFSGTEKYLHNYLISQQIILPAVDANEYFYFIFNDSAILFQKNINHGDTIKQQVHLVQTNTSANTTCENATWRIDKNEFIIKGKYRPNAVFNYAKYFKQFDAFSTDFAAVKNEGNWGFIDEEATVIIPFRYDKIKAHYFGIWLKNETGVCIYSLKTKKYSTTYDEIGITAPRINPYDISLSGIKKAGKSGMLNKDFVEQIPLIYDNITLLQQKFLLGNRNNKVVLINALTGKEISALYDKARVAQDNNYLEVANQVNGITTIQKIDMDGNIVKEK
jgi:hypothetical protein